MMGGVLFATEGTSTTASLTVRLHTSPSDEQIGEYCDALIAEASKRGKIESKSLDLTGLATGERIIARDGSTLLYRQVYDIENAEMICNLEMKFEVVA